MDFPIKHGDFPWQNVSSPEGNQQSSGGYNHLVTLGTLGYAMRNAQRPYPPCFGK